MYSVLEYYIYSLVATRLLGVQGPGQTAGAQRGSRGRLPT